MAAAYEWCSPRSANEVLETIQVLTNPKTRMYPFAFTHKRSKDNEIKFTLWYSPIFGSRVSYEPPNLKGNINDTPNGCKVLVE